MHHLLRQMVGFTVLALIVLIPAAFVLDHMLSGHLRAERIALLPPQLRNAEILYEANSGFAPGPGGNEAGIIVYSLPEDVLPAITGIDFFPPAQPGWQPWQETPVSDFPTWPTAPVEPSLNAFFQVELQIDPKLYETVDAAIKAPGSYLTRSGWRSFILVAPAQKRAYYAFSDW